MRTTLTTTALVASAVVLAGCGSGASGGAPAAAGGSSSASTVALRTWSSPLGDIVVTSDGSAVYAFDEDTPGAGTSACSGTCAHLWPAVTTTSSGTPQVSGVTGTVGTIATSGGRQLTLDGRPLYTYAGDGGPGRVSGEGVRGSWWAVSPSGQEVHGAPAAPSSSPSSSSSSSSPSSSDPGYSY